PVIADMRKVKQVLFNLLSNAAKFTPNGGTIVLSATLVAGAPEKVAADATAKNTNNKPSGKRRKPQAAAQAVAESTPAPDAETTILIQVRDTGIGISPDEHERIFGAFEQVDHSYSKHQQGTGLGLAVSRRLVELHGG